MRALVLFLILAAWLPAESARSSDASPSVLNDVSGLYMRVVDPALPQATIEFVTRDGVALTAFTYRASGFDPVTGPILFVMHGSSRDADSLLERFKPIGERQDALVVAPEFHASAYGPDSWPYTLGVGTPGLPGSSIYDPAEWRHTDDYVYSELEHLFDAIRIELGGQQSGYRLFGHSAGAQFTHRLITFRPDSRVETAVAANAGWYTLPTDEGGANPNFRFPYGLFATPLTAPEVDAVLAASMVILAGEHDTETADQDPLLRDTDEANSQGLNRRERAANYVDFSETLAAARQVPFGWIYDVVPGAGHSMTEVSASAGWYLFREPGDATCDPTSAEHATGLRVNEIHADAAEGAAGDASGDGVLGNDDFVEFVNVGPTPLCLDGWYLGDATRAERHRFPIGSRLESGEVLVVFDRGVPTGSFGGATVQWPTYSTVLSLSGSGDVLELRDHNGVPALSISWGDCDDQPCAGEYIPMSLSINESVTRSPPLTGGFERHSIVSGDRHSPGTYVPEPSIVHTVTLGFGLVVLLVRRRLRSAESPCNPLAPARSMVR